jgi:hypothetical protein
MAELFDVILHTERKQLSPELVVVWYWYDLTPTNSSYRYGTDENSPRCGLYRNGQLIATVDWNIHTVTLEMVERFLAFNSVYQHMPGWSPVPKTIKV